MFDDGIDTEEIASVAIPATLNVDRFWLHATRVLLEELINVVRNKSGNMSDVRTIVRTSTLEQLSELLKAHNAPSCGTINPKNERGSEAVRLTLLVELQNDFAAEEPVTINSVQT
jgi:hypothetical protein